MGKRRRLTHLASTSDDDEEADATAAKDKKATTSKKQRRRLDGEDLELEEEEEEGGEGEEEGDDGDDAQNSRRGRRRGRNRNARTDGSDDEERGKGEGGEEESTDAVATSNVIKVSGRGKRKKYHYSSFEYEGNTFELEDPVLLTPEDPSDKPYVAIIKDITEVNKSLMVTGQWFYRPQEAEKKGGGSWEARDTRELFYSFHFDDVPAESVMHKCVVHFVPQSKQLPNRKEHPGFIVQKVYDTIEKKLWKLTDKDYEDSKQREIDLLVQKTREHIGELPDLDPGDIPAENVDPLSNKRSLRRRPVSPIDVSKPDDASNRTDQFMKAETPGSDTLKNHGLLLRFKVLTGNTARDKWLDKFVDAIPLACNTKGSALADCKAPASAVPVDPSTTGNKSSTNIASAKDNCSNDNGKGYMPDVVVSVMAALVSSVHEALGSDFQKYNQKMRQLLFNIKNSPILARRLLNRELDPAVLLTMSPYELKAGLTAAERATSEPEEPKQLEMTDARCSRCMEKKVGIFEIIHGGHGDRYKLECTSCGHAWFSSRDAISLLTIDPPNTRGNVGTAPLATTKFEVLEKQLVSPREHVEKTAGDAFQKNTAANMPTLETQKSFNRSKSDETSVPTAKRE